MAKVSIVIVNFNGARFLRNCLSSIYDCMKFFDDVEVILVDNGSTDGSIEDVKRNFPNVRLIQNEKNFGFAKGNNIGILASNGDFVVLLNSDTVVTSRWLTELIKTTERDAKVGIVGPKTLRFDWRTLDTTGQIFHYRIGEAENRGSDESDRGQYDKETDVLGIQFSCALIKREVINSVGLLDDKIFLYLEDVDYCIRARLLGWKVTYCPSSVILHYAGGSTSKKESWNIRKFGIAYRLRVILKNYNALNALKWGIFGFVFYWGAMIVSIGNCTQDSLSYFYAFWWNLFNLPINERVRVQRKRIIRDEVIFGYWLKGRRW